MKKFVLLFSLPLSLVFIHVLSVPQPAPCRTAALDLQGYIGDLEYGAFEEDILEGSVVDGGAAAFALSSSAPSLFERGVSFVRAKTFQLQNILIKVQTLPQLALYVPVGFMLWFAHLGWYP